MANLYPYQKDTLRALGVYDPKPTSKRAKVKAARKANIRRMQIARRKGRPVRQDVWTRLAESFRRAGVSARRVSRQLRKVGRHIESYEFGGTITGRFLREPSPIERLAEARTKPFAERGKVVVVSTPLLGADYSDIERRVMAQLHDKTKIHADMLTRKTLENDNE